MLGDTIGMRHEAKQEIGNIQKREECGTQKKENGGLIR